MNAPASDRMTVLVLGVGGNVSQGILKALARSALDCRVVAGCVSPLSLGLFRADRSYISPWASDSGFVDWVADVCEREGVDAVLSGVEPVLEALVDSPKPLGGEDGPVVVASPGSVLAVGRDKLATAHWLGEHGLPHPATAAADDEEGVDGLVERVGFPLVAKPRRGRGGEGVLAVTGSSELELVRGQHDLVLQERLGDAHEEYTAGCVCDRDGALRGTLVMRRELHAGTTYRAVAGRYPDVREAAERVVRELAPVGPCNVQMRLTERGPVPFELNVRFSGTTPMRARLGFNEVEAVLRHLVLREPFAEMPRVEEGTVLRYWNELYVDPDGLASLERDGRLDDPRLRPGTVEDWGVDP